MRAVALLLVLAFHANVPLVGGGFVGVDVFFVISGFLITGLIVREADETGRLSLVNFYARRVRRLLPATAVVLAAVAGMTLTLLPSTRFESIAADILFAAVYVLNWRFAERSVDYLQSDDAPSPVQHFWSLAVEEQFYVVWPLVVLLLLRLQRRMRWSLTPTMLTGIAAIGVPALIWSVLFTKSSPSEAYFVSTTRAWELAVGATVAIVTHRGIALSRRVASLLSALGLVAIVVAASAYDSSTMFPGYAALLPTLGCAAVLLGGAVHADNRWARALAAPSLQAVGGLSYSWYLWHWPVLVVVTARFASDGRGLPLWMAACAVAVSVLPAFVTYRFVEMPFHRAAVFVGRPLTALGLGGVCTAIALVAAVLVYAAVPKTEGEGMSRRPAGGAVLGDSPLSRKNGWVVDTADFIAPTPAQAAQDEPRIHDRNCLSDPRRNSRLRICEQGPRDAKVTIAVVGDSKMHQWLPALQVTADRSGWRLKTILGSACPLIHGQARSSNGRAISACALFNQQRFAAVLEDKSIDYVLISQRARLAYLADDDTEEAGIAAMVADLKGTWAELGRAGKRVIVVLDNPAPTLDVRECVATHPTRLSACAFSRAEGEAGSGAATQRLALADAPDVAVVDMTDYLCPGDKCPAVIGNALVYRGGSHVTATYIETLAPQFGRALRRAMRKK